MLNLEKFSVISSPFSGQELVAEASDFGPLRDGYWWLERIYQDSADLGIRVLSNHTGRVVRYYLDEANDYFWKFRVCPEDSRGVKAPMVTIFRD